MINISQLSNDGIGHQLHGIFTLMCMHNVFDYYYDAYVYIENIISKDIEHIIQSDKQELINILLKIHELFIEEFKTEKKTYMNYTNSQPIINLSNNENTLNYLDSIFFFNKHFANIKENKTFISNYNLVKDIFRKTLNINEYNKQYETIIHIRHGKSNEYQYFNNIYIQTKYWESIKKLIIKMTNHNKNIIIHTDADNLDFIFNDFSDEKKKLVTIINKYNVLQALCDFINCKNLVISFSSLSTLAGLLSDNVFIIPDDKNNSLLGYDHSILNNNHILLSALL
jgi:hypothetical protein|tara:strand:+ start:175 stop:1023 length:849 start_codon:yes stop_codon:yes gene_type:complete